MFLRRKTHKVAIIFKERKEHKKKQRNKKEHTANDGQKEETDETAHIDRFEKSQSKSKAHLTHLHMDFMMPMNSLTLFSTNRTARLMAQRILALIIAI